ncbi:hypothetical protein AHAS_Ahas13G0420500 [Arachis hypogaea]
MVVGYVKVGNMVEAKRLFDEMPQRNVASWNAMIWDFVKVKNLGNARVVLDAMPEKSVASFTIMIDGYAKAGDMATSSWLPYMFVPCSDIPLQPDQEGDTYMYKVATSLEKSLQGFEYVYGDIVSGVIDVNELGFLVKHMECMVRKMDRYVSNTKNLYSEMEVLNQLEQAMNKFQNNQNDESRRVIEQKLASQRQDVRHQGLICPLKICSPSTSATKTDT